MTGFTSVDRFPSELYTKRTTLIQRLMLLNSKRILLPLTYDPSTVVRDDTQSTLTTPSGQ